MNRYLLLLILTAAFPMLHAQDNHVLYYQNGSKMIEGRWRYTNNTALPTTINDLNAIMSQVYSTGLPILKLPNDNYYLSKYTPTSLQIECEGMVRIWYPDGSPKALITFSKGVRTGAYKLYYPGGRLAQEGTMEDGMPKGPWKSYYLNGQLFFTGNFQPYTQAELALRFQQVLRGGYNAEDDSVVNGNLATEEKMVETYTVRHAFDPFVTGSISKKNGTFTFYDSSGKRQAVMNYSNNHRDGSWYLYSDKEQQVLQLEYQKGRLAYITDSTGTRQPVAAYAARIRKAWKHAHNGTGIAVMDEQLAYVEQMPEFPGNVSDYLQKNIQAPARMDKYRNDPVIVRFYVEENGEVSGIVLEKEVYKPFDQEIVRVISTMPKWRPGKKQGVPVRVPYKLKISFGLKTEFIK